MFLKKVFVLASWCYHIDSFPSKNAGKVILLHRSVSIFKDLVYPQHISVCVTFYVPFHNSINPQEHFFHRTRITSYLRPVNIATFLRTAFLYTSKSSRLQMFFKIGVLKRSANFTEKHLCWIYFQKNLQVQGLLFIIKRLQHRRFPVRFTQFLETPFFIEHIRWLIL